MQRRGFVTGLFAAALAAPLLLGQDAPPPPKPGEPRPPEPRPNDPATPPRPDQKVKLTGSRGFERAQGHGRYRDRPDERELDIAVEKAPLPYGTPLTVLINGLKVGEIKVGLLHGGKLKLRSKDKDVIPVITIGTPVVVRTKDAVVATGRF